MAEAWIWPLCRAQRIGEDVNAESKSAKKSYFGFAQLQRRDCRIFAELSSVWGKDLPTIRIREI